MAKRKPIEQPSASAVSLLRLRYRDKPAAVEAINGAISFWIAKIKMARLADLAREFGIDPQAKGSPLRLALALAEKHEAGFQVEGFEKPVGKVGRRKGSDVDEPKLMMAVWAEMDKPHVRTVLDATKRLARTPSWKDWSALALKAAYYRARRHHGPIDENDAFTKFVIELAEFAEEDARSKLQKQATFSEPESANNAASPQALANGDARWKTRNTTLG